MAVFFITMAVQGDRGPVWFPFDVPAADTMAALFALLKQDEAIFGRRIMLSKDGDRTARRVVSRHDCILGRSAIGMIRPPHFPMDGPHGWTVPESI